MSVILSVILFNPLPINQFESQVYLWISFNMEEIILNLKGGSLFNFFILKCSSKQSLLRNIRILKKCASEHFNHKLAPVPPQRSIILGTIGSSIGKYTKFLDDF